MSKLSTFRTTASGVAALVAGNSGTGFFSVLKSAAAAAFGVQSQSNRENDFNNGKPIHFILAGILMTLLFLAGVGLFVKYMIATTG